MLLNYGLIVTSGRVAVVVVERGRALEVGASGPSTMARTYP